MKNETSLPAREHDAAKALAINVLPVPGAPYKRRHFKTFEDFRIEQREEHHLFQSVNVFIQASYGVERQRRIHRQWSNFCILGFANLLRSAPCRRYILERLTKRRIERCRCYSYSQYLFEERHSGATRRNRPRQNRRYHRAIDLTVFCHSSAPTVAFPR